MTKCFSLKIMLVWLPLLCASVDAFAQLEWGNQGNGTFINPVLNADYSDPDVIRVGDKYYMIASDFHFMGMQVLESDDMVNWHIISQVYDRFDYPGWNVNNHYAGGCWAPALRYHDGRFWVFFCTYDEGLFMSSATDPKGPWTPLHCVKETPKWEDPCPFWDEDGTAYLGRSRWKAGPIIIHKMSPDGKQLLDDGVTVYTGPVAEGTKMLKRNGYYYLVIPEGGVAKGWQTVLRSKDIYGPYEKKVVLEQGMTDVNGPHQGALVDTPDGRWYFYHFQSTNPNGRVVHLQPVRWIEDWPVMGADLDMNDIGEPVHVWATPFAPSVSALPQTDDDFSGDTWAWRGQHRSALGLQWQWNHNPDKACWSLTDRKGWFTLRARQSDGLKMCRNMLTQKVMGYESEAMTRIDVRLLRENTFAGLHCIGKVFRGVGIMQQGGRRFLCVEEDGSRKQIALLKSSVIYLKAHIDSRANKLSFLYSTDNKTFVPVAQALKMNKGYWKGIRVGLFCYNTKGDEGTAQFDYFRYHIMK